jgi:hypothetical protein
MYRSRKPEMPATTTFVSTTAGCFRFLDFGCNGDLRHSPFLTVTANGSLNLLFGDLPYVFGRLGGRVKEFILPSRTLPLARHVTVENRSALALFNLLAKRKKRNSQFDGLLLGREARVPSDSFRRNATFAVRSVSLSKR